jgi:hypothetical protein
MRQKSYGWHSTKRWIPRYQDIIRVSPWNWRNGFAMIAASHAQITDAMLAGEKSDIKMD